MITSAIDVAVVVLVGRDAKRLNRSTFSRAYRPLVASLSHPAPVKLVWSESITVIARH